MPGEFCLEASKPLKQREGRRHGWMSDSLMKEAQQEGNYTPLSALLLPRLPAPIHRSLIISKKLCSEVFLLKLPEKRHPLYIWPFLFLCLPRRQILPVRSNRQQVCTTLFLPPHSLKEIYIYKRHDSDCKREGGKRWGGVNQFAPWPNSRQRDLVLGENGVWTT